MKPYFFVWTLMMTLTMMAHASSPSEKLRRLISSAQAQCPTLTCASSSVRVHTLTATEYRNLDSKIQSDLNLIVYEMSQIWGDTILEGNYFSDEPAKLEKVQAVYQDSLFLGYRLTYSAPAWETSQCEVVIEDRTSLEKCRPGKIVESAFVTANREGFFQDPHARATFVE